MRKYRHFDEDFKRDVVARIDSGAITQAQASREHNLSPSLIDRWQKQIHEGTLRSRPSAREKQLERELEDHRFTISMSRKGNPYDNAFAESFMKTWKKEEVYLWEYESFTDVVERVPQFIESVYNRKRVHAGIGYLPPVEFEDLLQDKERKQEPGQVTLLLSD